MAVKIKQKTTASTFTDLATLITPSDVTITSNTASWGNAVIVGTVGGKNLKFTMPSNPNTNYYHTPDYSSGLKIATGSGVNSLYVPDATTSQKGVLVLSSTNLNTMINQLSTGDSVPGGNDYYISQYANGGTTTTTYHRRPVSKLAEYIRGSNTSALKVSTINAPTSAGGSTYGPGSNGQVLKTNGSTVYWGNAPSASDPTVEQTFAPFDTGNYFPLILGFDNDQNASFQDVTNKVYYSANSNLYAQPDTGELFATTFVENGVDLADKYLGISATAANSSKLGGQLPAYYTPKDAIDLSGQTVSLLTLVQALGTSGTQYAKYICKTDGGSRNISNRPTTNDAGFVCEVLCNRWVGTNDYRYILRYYQQNDLNAFLSQISPGMTTISWTRTNTNTDVNVTQNVSTTSDYRPLILGQSNANPTSFADTTSITYYNKTLYVQPSTGSLYANVLYENGTSLASKYLGISSKAADSSKLNGQEASYYLNYNNLSNKPTIDNNNQKVKAGSVTFDANDTVNFVGSGIVSVTGDATNDAITISASHQSIKTLKTDNTTAQSTSSSEAIAGSGTINLHKVAKTGTYSDLISKPTLGTAAAKNFTTSVTSGSSDLVTSGAVFTAIDNLPEPMVFKGTLGTNGTITSLPTASSSNEGYTYKVITAGTYASQSAKVGDVFVSNGSSWVIVPAGDDVEDTWRNIKVNDTQLLGTGISTGAVNFKNGGNITVTGSGNNITLGVASGYSIPSTTNQNAWSAKYDKPSGGIPASDLAQSYATQVKVGSTAYNPSSGVISLPAYPTKSSWNYDDTYLKLTGGSLSGGITLPNGDSAYNTNGIIFSHGSRIGENNSGQLGFYSTDAFFIRPYSNGGASSYGLKMTSSDFSPTANKSMSLGTSSYMYNNVYATTIYENGTALSSKYLGISSKASDADKLDGQDSTYYLNYNNLTNKPTIPTDTNQTVKGNGTAFGANDAVDIVGGTNIAVTPDTTNKKITVGVSYPKVTYSNFATNGLRKFIAQTDYSKPFYAHVKIYVSSSTAAINQVIECYVVGRSDNIKVYGFDSTRTTWSSNSGIYQIRAYTPKDQTSTYASYAGGVAFNINSTTARNIEVEIFELENCTVLDTPAADGYNSTYHNNTAPYTCSNRLFGGDLQGSCDTATNSRCLVFADTAIKTSMSVGIGRYTLYVYDSQRGDGASITSTFNSTGTSHVVNTTTVFHFGSHIMYNSVNGDYAASTSSSTVKTSTYSQYTSQYNLDLRYSCNCSTTGFTIDQPLYLRITPNFSTGTFTIHSDGLTQTLTNNGYYIYLGIINHGTTYRLHLVEDQRMYFYNGTNLLEYGSASYKNYTTSVTQNSNDLVTSGAVYTAIANAITTALNTAV